MLAYSFKRISRNFNFNSKHFFFGLDLLARRLKIIPRNIENKVNKTIPVLDMVALCNSDKYQRCERF